MSSGSAPNLDQSSSQQGYSAVFLSPLSRRTVLSINGDRDANSSPPEPPVRDSSSLKYIKYGPGHEKFPSWPVPAASETSSRPTTGGYSTRSKSWTDNTSYPKEKVVTYTRPYMKRQHSQYTQQKLKTVMERCEKIPAETFEAHHNENIPNHLYIPNVEHDAQLTGSIDYNLPSPPERDYSKRSPTHKEMEDYTNAYHENLRFRFEHSTNRLTEKGLEELMEYNKTQEESAYSSMYDNNEDGMITHIHHQKQVSYAQSEGYHSYVSSTDSTSTPFLDRLRRDSHALVSQQPSSATWGEESSSRREGRDSVVTTSSGSASSSDTLKWHGSMSDVSVANSSCTYLADQSNASSQQLIVHSARVQTPQRHRSESVLYMSGFVHNPHEDKKAKHRKEGPRSSVNKLKLFPVETSLDQDTVGEHESNISNNRINNSSKNRLSLSLQSPISVASRTIEFEKQKYSYLDPHKKHRVPDPTLKAIQKKALLSFYERHQQNGDYSKVQYGSEPQLPSQQTSSKGAPLKIKVAHSLRRASSINSYSARNSRRNSLVSSADLHTAEYKENGRSSLGYQHSSNSCSSLKSADLLGPVIIGSSISIDDYASRKPPDRPPKNPNLRTVFPDLFNDQRVPSPDLPPPSPPAVLEDEVFDNDDPLPPPPPECGSGFQGDIPESNQKDSIISTRKQIPEPQVQKSSNSFNNVILNQNIGIPERSIPYSLIKTKPSEHIIQQVRIKPNPLLLQEMQRKKSQSLGIPREYSGFSSNMGMKVLSSKTSKDDSPPPLQPRQLRIYRSMRGEMTHEHRTRLSPPKEVVGEGRLPLQNRSKGSYLTTRTEKDGISSDTGTYKRALSPSDHFDPSQVFNDGGNAKSRELIWPQRRQSKDELKTNNNAVLSNSSKRTSPKDLVNCNNSNCDSDVVNNWVLRPTVLPDVLPANAKMKPRSSLSPHELPVKLKFSSFEENKLNSKIKSPPPPLKINPSQSSLKSAIQRSSPVRTMDLSLTTSLQSSVSTTSSLASLRNTSTISESQNRSFNGQQCRSVNSVTSMKSPIMETNPSPIKESTHKFTSTLCSSPLTKSYLSSPVNQISTPVPLESDNDISGSISPSGSKMAVNGSSDIEGLLVQKTEVVLRINSATNDASSQTEKDELPTAPSPPRKDVDEEVDYEKLSQDFVSQLPTTSILKTLLVPKPDHKKPREYVQDLFKVDASLRSRAIFSTADNASKKDDGGSPATGPSADVTVLDKKLSLPSSTSAHDAASSLPCSSMYFTTSEPKAKFLTMFCQDMNQTNGVKDTKDLHRQKEELVNRLSRKLDVLRGEALIVSEECKVNEELGVTVGNSINQVASPQEVYKFRLHVEEVGKITSLLLGLSGRLARAENALMNIEDDHPEKSILESKWNKLQDQLEEAKNLKESIDKRSVNVSNILYKYLSTEEYADYDHFINMKAKLIMDSKEIQDKIKLGEEQLAALRDTLIVTD
ncbi:protein Shroom isoform X1 [Euwallacea similis]|uniref:protein Shroom isoform X1 n=1 Tax=Euwallacea similis TaxID=1736056 RepID=UPI00345064EF